MEEDIKVLEEYVQEFNENKKKYKLAYSTGFGKFWSDFVKTIENLINRNKQLEEIEKEHKKENGELQKKIKELEEHNIPKSKVIKKIEEIEKEGIWIDEDYYYNEELGEEYPICKKNLQKKN